MYNIFRDTFSRPKLVRDYSPGKEPKVKPPVWKRVFRELSNNLNIITKSKKFKKKKVLRIPMLSACVCNELKRLGATYCPKPQRKYNGFTIPKEIQSFLDFKFPQDLEYCNLEFGIYNLQFVDDPNVDGLENFQFFKDHNDAILIADGDAKVVALMNETRNLNLHNNEFYIYLLSSPFSKPEGPILLSSFLEGCMVKIMYD